MKILSFEDFLFEEEKSIRELVREILTPIK
jgi:hypothetical protein